MWGLGHLKYLEEKIKHRATLRTCPSCGFYYPRSQKICHHCNGMANEEVLRNLARKKYFRTNLGKGMFLGAFVILLLMYFFNT